MAECLGSIASRLCQPAPPAKHVSAQVSAQGRSSHAPELKRQEVQPEVPQSCEGENQDSLFAARLRHAGGLAVLLWVLLQIMDWCFPAFASFRAAPALWSFLPFFYFCMPRHSTKAEVPVAALPVQAAASQDSSVDIESFVKDLQDRLDTTGPNSAQVAWRDASKPKLQLQMAFPKKPSRLLVNLQIQISDQADDLPLVAENGSGLIPIFCSLGQWPLWLPFCQSASMISQIGPGQEIWLVRFKIAFITADCVLYVGIHNRLHAGGQVDILMGSPRPGSEGSTWLGVQVPAQTAQLRVPINSFRLSLQPASMLDGSVNLQADMIDTLKIEWIHMLFWQTLGSQVIPIVRGMQFKFVGSALDDFYNGGSKAGTAARSFFADLAKEDRKSVV